MEGMDALKVGPAALALRMVDREIVYTVGELENLETIITGMRSVSGTVLLIPSANYLGSATGGMVVVQARHIVAIDVPKELVDLMNAEDKEAGQ